VILLVSSSAWLSNPRVRVTMFTLGWIFLSLSRVDRVSIGGGAGGDGSVCSFFFIKGVVLPPSPWGSPRSVELLYTGLRGPFTWS
jgi:hypothetical protein